MESDGSAKPYRVHLVTPTFSNLQAVPIMSKKHYIADLIGIVGSIDIVLGDADR
jgi:NADH-quinone oxidoreductase subunit D